MKILNFNFAKGPKKKWLGFLCVCKTYEIKKIVNIVDIIPSIIWQKLQNMNKERDQNQFFFYKNGPLWSARSGRGNRWECGLAAKANAKDLIRGRGELIKFWELENCKFSWIEKIVPLYIHCPWLLPCIKKVAIEPLIRSLLQWCH